MVGFEKLDPDAECLCCDFRKDFRDLAIYILISLLAFCSLVLIPQFSFMFTKRKQYSPKQKFMLPLCYTNTIKYFVIILLI